MGKPSPNLARPSDDAVSLHTQPGDRYLDDDAPELQVDDLPPLYTDAASESSSAPLLPATAHQSPGAHDLISFWEDANTGAKGYMSHILDNDPKKLESYVQYWAQTPPRPYVRVLGTHRATVDNTGKKERKAVTDFDVHIELTPYLFSNDQHRASWRQLVTVDNGERTRRGTVFRCRAPGAKQSIEVGGDAKPTLLEWCHRYCASHAGLKCFQLKRQVVGFDETKVKQKIEALVRGTNYRGHLDITFPVKDEVVLVYNEARTNAWRMMWWIHWLCIFTLMFIFTWPYLFFRTKRFEVVRAEWPFSRPREDGGKEYVSLSEDQWYNMWGRALGRAVLEKRQCTLDQQDLIAAEGAQPDIQTGNSAVDGALGFLRAGVNAMNEVNRQLGWGGDC